MKVTGILIVCVGCSVAPDTSHIDVNTQNALGVTTLEVVRADDLGNSTFTLRGLSSDARELASVQRTIGDIPDIAEWAPVPSDVGSEIVVSVGEIPVRIVSLETRRAYLARDLLADPNGMAFLQLPEVTAVLAREASIVVEPPTNPDEQTYSNEVAKSCLGGYMQSNKSNNQCCEDYNTATPGAINTIHFGAGIVRRTRNPTGVACRASDGVTTCGGKNCYFGPNSFAIASLQTAPPADPYAHIYTSFHEPNNTYCEGAFYNRTRQPQFSNVIGTLPAGCGCCGNGAGACCGAACASCNVTAHDEAAGKWDY